jgi:hypothetical protein
MDRELVLARAGRIERLHELHAGSVEATPIHRWADVRVVVLFEKGVLVQREDRLKPAQEGCHGVLDARRVLELKRDVHECVVHAVEDPRDRGNQGIVSLLVGRICRYLKVGQHLLERTTRIEEEVAGVGVEAAVRQ